MASHKLQDEERNTLAVRLFALSGNAVKSPQDLELERVLTDRNAALAAYRRTKDVLAWYDDHSVGLDKIRLAREFHDKAVARCIALGITAQELCAL